MTPSRASSSGFKSGYLSFCADPRGGRTSPMAGILCSGEKSTFQRSSSNSSSRWSRCKATDTSTPSASSNSASPIHRPKRRSAAPAKRRLPIPPSFISSTRPKCPCKG